MSMVATKKIGLATLISAITLWAILEGIGIVIGMSLRPRFTLVFMVMAIIGVIMIIVSFVAAHLKDQSKGYKVFLWVLLELVLVVLLVVISFLVLVNMPLEETTSEGLVIHYLEDSYITEDYNFIYFR